MLVDVIRSGDAIVCYIVHGGEFPMETEFVTPPDAALQVGHIVHPSGHEIERHTHRLVERRITGSAEVLMVQRGRCEIDVYDAEQCVVATRELSAGDIVVMLAGGHGFRMLEDTVLFEVKQGPYLGPDEKKPF